LLSSVSVRAAAGALCALEGRPLDLDREGFCVGRGWVVSSSTYEGRGVGVKKGIYCHILPWWLCARQTSLKYTIA
jgi:hypothetical protein